MTLADGQSIDVAMLDSIMPYMAWVAANLLIGQSIGAGDRALAKRVVGTAIIFFDAAFAGERFDRIAGNKTNENENQQRDSDEGRNHKAYPCGDETQHVNVRRNGSLRSAKA